MRMKVLDTSSNEITTPAATRGVRDQMDSWKSQCLTTVSDPPKSGISAPKLPFPAFPFLPNRRGKEDLNPRKGRGKEGARIARKGRARRGKEEEGKV
jgi:hypothetical protein